MSAPVPPPTLTDKLGLIPSGLLALVRTAANVGALPFRSAEDRANTTGEDVFRAFARAMTGTLSIRQLQVLLPSTSATFDKWVKEHPGEIFSSEAIGEGAKLHWVGDRKAERIILFFHGGGYALPLSVPHIKLVSHFRKASAQATGLNVSVALLEYSFVPYAPHPTQFRQAAAALTHLLNTGLSPSSIILGGDSAGAHLAFTLISHILHPHPSVPPVPALSAPLAGVLLISPRPSAAMSAPSYAQNSNKDILTADTIRHWVRAYTQGTSLAEPGGVARDGPYTSPVDAPRDWWDGFATRVARRVLITGGQQECLRDDIVRLAEMWREVDGVQVTLEIEPKAVHDTPMHDIDAGRLGTALQRSMEDWFITSFTK